MDFAAASLRKGEVGETRGGGKVDLDEVGSSPSLPWKPEGIVFAFVE
jgi:hypothetical protein